LAKLVATLGRTPGGVVETLRNLREGRYVREGAGLGVGAGGAVGEVEAAPKPVEISEVVVVRTREVEESFEVLRALLTCCADWKVDLREVVLPMDDVEEPRHFRVVRERLARSLRVGDYVDFTGGRKAISAAAVLAAREAGAHLVTTLIPQEDYYRLERVYGEVRLRALRVVTPQECFAELCGLVLHHAKTLVLT